MLLNRKIFYETDIIMQEYHLTIVKVKLLNFNILITGVYLLSSGSNDFIENYKIQLATIQGIHEQFSSLEESIILGDFQCCPAVANLSLKMVFSFSSSDLLLPSSIFK